MNITMLGSGCWEGVPAPFCGCRICNHASENPLSQENRTRPSFFVESDKTKFMIEMSPDLRVQSTRFKLPPVTDYIVSHWHFDHLFGLYELHAWIELVIKKPINIYCSASVSDMIQSQFGFIPTSVTIIKAYEEFKIGSVSITPLPVYHMRSADEGKEPDELDNTFGFLVESDGRKVSYLADYYKIPEKTIELASGSEVVIADGTYLFESKYPDKPYQNETLKENDPDHLHGNDILDIASSMDSKAVYYHSITHLPETYHKDMQEWLPKGHYIGSDGKKLI